MAGINFTIANPNSIPKVGQPVIYTDAVDKNELDFSITNNLGIPYFEPTYQLRISFPKDLLVNASADMLAMKGWKVKDIDASGKYYVFVCVPRKRIPFKEAMVLTFKGMQGKTQTSGEVSLQATIQGNIVEGGDTKMFVTTYPGQPKNLTTAGLYPEGYINSKQNAVKSGTVFLSSPKLKPPIANQIELNLKFQGDTNLVEKWNAGKVPFFEFSFSYGSSSDDLTDTTQVGDKNWNEITQQTTAYRIETALENESTRWKLLNNTGVIKWRVTPTDVNQQLFTKENPNLDILFNHIITNLPGDNATLFIQWGNIPGYNPGWMARNIPKQEKVNEPQVLSFTDKDGNKESDLVFGKGIALDWSTFAAPKVQLRCEENPDLQQVFEVPPKPVTPVLTYCGGVRPDNKRKKDDCSSLVTQSIVPVDPVNNFYLRPLNEKGEAVGEEVGPVTISIPNYPKPSLKENLNAEGAIFEVTENGTPTYYYNEMGGTIIIKWKLNNPEIVNSIQIEDPSGNTINLDAKQPVFQIRTALEGKYLVHFISKQPGLKTSQGIVLKPLSPQIKGQNYDTGKLTATQKDVPITTPLFLWPPKGKMEYNGDYFKEADFVFTYQMQLSFKADGTGTAQLVQPTYKVQYNTKCFDKKLLPPGISICVHFKTQPKIGTISAKIPDKAFGWKMETNGNLYLTFSEDKSLWMLTLDKQKSTPNDLTYSAKKTQPPTGIDPWNVSVASVVFNPFVGTVENIVKANIGNQHSEVKAEGVTYSYPIAKPFSIIVKPNPADMTFNKA